MLKTFPEQLTRTRCQVYLTDEKKNKLLGFYQGLTPQEQAQIKNHSDFYFFLLHRNTGPNVLQENDLQQKLDLQTIRFSDYLNALQTFARKVSADLHRETEGLFSRQLSIDEIAAAMQDYAADESETVFPSEKFVTKLLNLWDQHKKHAL